MATTVEYEPSRHVERYLTRLEGLVAEQTHRSNKSYFKHYEEWLRAEHDGDVTSVGPLTIEDFLIALSNDGYAGGTVNKHYYALKKFYEFLDEKVDVIEETPFKGVDREDLSRVLSGNRKADAAREDITYLTPEEVDQVAENVPAPRFRNELMIRLQFQTGVRQGELVNIKIDDIDRDERSIRIHAEKTGKNRTVYYQPSLDFLMNQWLDGGERAAFPPAHDSPYLFLSRSSEQLRDNRVNKVVKEASKEAGLNEVLYTDAKGDKRWKISSHSLRHSHAIASIRSNIDIERVRRHMGHASLDQTQQYLRFAEQDVKEAYAKFDA